MSDDEMWALINAGTSVTFLIVQVILWTVVILPARKAAREAKTDLDRMKSVCTCRAHDRILTEEQLKNPNLPF